MTRILDERTVAGTKITISMFLVSELFPSTRSDASCRKKGRRKKIPGHRPVETYITV